MKRAIHKPLSFSTTMRNPERITAFLDCIREFDGQVLTSNVISQIIKKVIKNKLYEPMYINRNQYLKSIFNDEEAYFSDEQLEDIIDNSEQKHKEAGFEKGWDSRFDTWYKLCKELGFIYYHMNEPIQISQTGHMLCNSYGFENSSKNIQNVFLNALVKYQTNNPFRRNLNKNAPIPLLLNVLSLLKSDQAENDAGIHRKELAFFLCWENKNHTEFYEYIKKFRAEYGYTASDEIVYEYCLKLLKSDNQNRFKSKQILQEGVDDLIRKLRITGIFSLRGLGRFIDLNSLEKEKINYIIDTYTKYKEFSDEKAFFSYMGMIDPNIIKTQQEKTVDLSDIRQKALSDFSKKYSNEQIYNELISLEKNGNSKDQFLRLIEKPTRLEFLTSLALVKNYPNATVKPNYSVDDEGVPTFTAKGEIADIEVYEVETDSLVEVTLMKSKQQAINEIPAITRHLREQAEKSNKSNVFSLFVAPLIHQDTQYMCEFTKYRDNLDIIPKTISEFTQMLPNTKNIGDFLRINYS